MRYHVPLLRPGVESRSPGLLSKLFGTGGSGGAPSVERFGGVPFGLPAERWPRCAVCGKSQSLLAQLGHDPERLPLGRAGRMMFVFQCNHDPGMCETWDQDSGANAAFVLEPEQLGTTEGKVPEDAPPPDPAAFVTGWEAQEDGLTPEQASAFFSDATLDALDDALLDEERDGGTHFGGVPCWVQSADEAPRGWRFLGQIADFYSFSEEMIQAHNFGDMGIAYLFADDSEVGVPTIKMFWQCG